MADVGTTQWSRTQQNNNYSLLRLIPHGEELAAEEEKPLSFTGS